MGLATLFKKLAADNGIELDADELDSLGLADDEAAPAVEATSLDVLGDVLSGEAAGAVEIFLSQPVTMLAGGKALEQDGLMWEPVIRSGQWAMRPGAGGQKRRSPLKVIAGHSKNQRKQIGLADIVDAFNDGAIEHVTVPTSHDNKVTENTGFIKGLKIVKGKVKDKLSKKDVEVDVLMAGYDIRLPEIKKQMQLGTIASRSAGLLYDYVNTETGKVYGVVLEHVALTNKPWITGMKAFGRKLVGKKLADTIGLSLSDEDPGDDDLLSEDDALDGLELADVSGSSWTQDEDPDWLREQTSNFLRLKRAEKAAKLMPNGGDRWLVMDGMPSYRCVRAKPGTALIADDWGDQANFWTAPIKVVDGFVEVDEDLDTWQAVKREYIADEDRKEFPEGREPLDETKTAETVEPPVVQLSKLELAQQARKARATSDEGAKPTNNETTSEGGEHMADENGALKLSDEAQAAIRAAEARAEAAENAATKLSERLDKIVGSLSKTSADTYIATLKSEGFDEAHGFSGVLDVVHELMSVDDGEPAVQSEKFADADAGNPDGTLSLSEGIMRIFKAFKRTEDGKLALGEQVTQSATTSTAKTGEAETKLGDDGKPLPATPEETSVEDMSDDEFMRELAKDNPELAKNMKLAIPAPVGTTEGSGS